MEISQRENAEQLRLALNHLKLALELLDEARAPAQIGAHVDLAINYLEDALPGKIANSGSYQMDRNADIQ